MSESNSILKPCPFCGSTKLKVDQKTSSNTKWNPETRRCDKLVVVTSAERNAMQEVRQPRCMLGGTINRSKHWKTRQSQRRTGEQVMNHE